ncbi:MAG: mechanosensitive ion channel [Rhodoferax sp.]
MPLKIALLLLALLVSPWARPQTPPNPSAHTASVTRSDEATLQVFNRPILVFRAPLLGVSAPDRAARARARIQAQLAAPGPHQVTEKREAVGVLVQIDGATSFIVTADDTDRLEQEPLELAAGRAAEALRRVVQETRESRDPDALARGAGMALAATLAFGLLAWGLRHLRDAGRRWLVVAAQRHAGRLQLAGVQVVRRERMAHLVERLLTGLWWVVVLLLAIEWTGYVLTRFPFSRPWGEMLNGFLFDLAGRLLHATFAAVPGLLTALVIFLLARFVTRLVHSFFERMRTTPSQPAWLDAEAVVATRRIAKLLVWLFALAMAYPYLPGAQTEAFRGLSVLVGLMVSLGASSLVGQAASGLILTYGRVYRKGEYVRVGEHEGTVMDLGVFATRLRTGLGEELTLSNATVLAATTRNYSRAVQGEGFVLDTTVTIGYDTPWRQVHAMLCEAARRTEGVVADPAPQVFQTALSDWYPQYRLVCQAVPAEPRSRALVLSALHAHIQDVFNEHGVQIMSPHYFEDPAAPKVVPPAKWFTPPARP